MVLHSTSRLARNPRTCETPRRSVRIAGACLLALGCLNLAACNIQLPLGQPAKSPFLTDVARRATLEITTIERGSLGSASNVVLSNRVEGSTTIISIVPEGTSAVEGQVLVELDSSKLRDSLTQQQIVVEQAEAALKQATEALAIQKTQNESDKAAADLKLTLVKLDLDKYKSGDYIQEKKTNEGEITLAQEEVTRAQEKYEFSKRQSRKGYVNQSELEADRIAVTKAEISLSVARKKLEVLDKFTYVRMIAELDANSIEFEREKDRVQRKASAALAQAEANLSASKLTAAVERSKLEKFESQVDACTIRAPQAGEVVYANESDRRGGNEVVVQEGAQVRERQAIINLPDFTRMQVNTRIHESRIGFVRTGLNAIIRVDANPGEEFHGVVETVSSVPLSGNWPNRDLKEYSAVVRLTDPIDVVRRLKPGLTAEVEIQVERIPSALLVPVQAVVKYGDKHLVFVPEDNKAKQREVVIGKTNDVMVQIIEEKSQLKVGEDVILHPNDFLDRSKEPKPEESAKESEPKPGDAPAKPGQPTPPGGTGGPGTAGPPAVAGGLPAGAPGGGNGPRDPAAFFARMDSDGDGKLAAAEIPERMQAMVGTLDKDGDGALTLEEFQAGAASIPRGPRPPAATEAGGG